MPRRSRRAVYDPTIENDQLMKTTLFRDDPLAVCDPEDDIRQWNNASTHSYFSGGSKRKWCYLVATVTTILLMITVGVTVRNKNSSDSNSNSSNNLTGGNTEGNTTPAAAPTSSLATLDPPITTLTQLCSRDRVEQADRRGLCEAECSKAACCALDCNKGDNVSICQAYGKICEILLVTEIIPDAAISLSMPPPELSDVCALEQLIDKQGYQKCQAMCETASCCHLPMSDPGSCNVPYHTECIAYHSLCGILDHVTAPIEERPKELDIPSDQLVSLCAMDQLQTLEGYETCLAACEPASCCTATQESKQNCFQEYGSVCEEYAEPCGALLQVVPPAPDDLPARCGVDQLDTVAGYEACEAICERATCCRGDEGALMSSCTSNDLCAEYQGPCSTLETVMKPSSAETPVAANDGASANRMHPPPSYITEQCTVENIQSTPGGRQRCADICVEAECCNYPSNLPELSCLAGNEDVCADYFSYCSLLDGASDEDEEMKDPSQWSMEYAGTDIYSACSDLSTTDGLQTCHDVCTEARCCYTTGTDSCIDDERCDDFDMCFNYKALMYIHEDIPSLIQQNCADLESLEGLELCEASCEQAVCCFANDDNMMDCEGQDLSYCGQYAACEELMQLDLDSPDQTLDPIGTNCDDLVTLKGIQLCQTLCEPVVCCYTNDNTIQCTQEDMDKCGSGYAECENLYDLAVEDPHRVSGLIEQSCADLVSFEGRELCESSCKMAACCFVDDNTTDCEGPRLSYCSQYQACEAFFNDTESGTDGNDVIDVPESEPKPLLEQIESACGNINVDYETCLTLCDKGRCCWNSDEPSCSSGTDCSTYEACSALN